MFPEGGKLSTFTPAQLALRAAVLSSNYSANLNFTTAGYLNLTYAYQNTAAVNQLGVFLFYPNQTIIKGSLVRAGAWRGRGRLKTGYGQLCSRPPSNPVAGHPSATL